MLQKAERNHERQLIPADLVLGRVGRRPKPGNKLRGTAMAGHTPCRAPDMPQRVLLSEEYL